MIDLSRVGDCTAQWGTTTGSSFGRDSGRRSQTVIDGYRRRSRRRQQQTWVQSNNDDVDLEYARLLVDLEGRPISAIRFANFGDSNGTCGALVTGSCQGRNDAISIVQHACVGKESCWIEASEVVFGSTNCDGVARSW
ncbi:beta-galactosidase 15-like [Diospyros lotus]|uniref:beta-galactosidase 15-like n=1 Tax=Diospyros lotus TaxID=55363 RepID=UPI00225516D2|nr:beta-galactosidase 15-like [Diospyros lotus]